MASRASARQARKRVFSFYVFASIPSVYFFNKVRNLSSRLFHSHMSSPPKQLVFFLTFTQFVQRFLKASSLMMAVPPSVVTWWTQRRLPAASGSEHSESARTPKKPRETTSQRMVGRFNSDATCFAACCAVPRL